MFIKLIFLNLKTKNKIKGEMTKILLKFTNIMLD